MDWGALILGFLVGALGGFWFGWFVFDRYRARTIRAHLAELTHIDERLKVIQGKMLVNDPDLTPAEVAEFISTHRYVKDEDDGKEKGRKAEKPTADPTMP